MQNQTRLPEVHRRSVIAGVVTTLLLSPIAMSQQQLTDLPEFGDYLSYAFETTDAGPSQCGTNCAKAVAIDGDLLVLGAEETADSAAIVLQRGGQGWEKVGNLFRGGTLLETSFAEAVAVEDGVIAVLAVDHTVNGAPGRVYLYFEPSGGWPGPDGWVFHSIELVGLRAADGRFASLAIDNGVVFAGVQGASWVRATAAHGGVQVWEPPYPNWASYQAQLRGRSRGGEPPQIAPDHNLIPSAFPIGGSRMGAHVRPGRTPNGQDLVVAGPQCLWNWARSGLTWKFESRGYFCLPNGRELTSMDYDGTHFAVGSRDNDISTRDLAYVGDAVDQSGGWLAATLGVLDDGVPLTAGDGFGQSVSLFNDELLVGSPETGVVQSNDGAVFRFLRGASGWVDTEVDRYDDIFEPPRPVVDGKFLDRAFWGDSMARTGPRLAITYPNSSNRGGVSIFEPAALFEDGFESGSTSAWGSQRGAVQSTPSPGSDLVTAKGNRLYLSKAGFCAETAARHATYVGSPPTSDCTGELDDQLPNDGIVATPATLGSLTFDASMTLHLGSHWTDGLPGPDIAISGPENMTVRTAVDTPDIYAIGFLVFEPNDLSASTDGMEDDSRFTVRLYLDANLVDSFDFNAGDNKATFVGIWTDEPFDRVEIQESLFYPDLSGSLGANEYFGPFYTGTVARP